MATTTLPTMIPTPSKNVVAKRPGPPVPPRPHQSSLYKIHRDVTVQRSSLSKTAAGQEHPQILKKPTVMQGNSSSISTLATPPPPSANQVSSGRTVIYKSPSLNLAKRQDERENRNETQSMQTQIPTSKVNAVTQTVTKMATNGTHAPKPPLKLRKAPDVPTANKPPPSRPLAPQPAEISINKNNNEAKIQTTTTSGNASNIVIVQSPQNVVALNRHHSMNTPKPISTLKEIRLSLGRADFERVGKVHLDQLQPTTQPLPRPRKIVKIPVATLDVDETVSNSNSTSSTNTSSSHISLFKRSKTTLDNFTSRSHITTVTTGNSGGGGFLSGRTVEIKNNLKNAAERLFSEIMVNQQKNSGTDSAASNTIITKHERAIQHHHNHNPKKTLMETGASDSSVTLPPHQTVTLVNSTQQKDGNCTRINITATSASPPPTSPPNNGNGKNHQQQTQQQHVVVAPRQVVSAFNSPEKKSAAFHEMLISELAAMRTRSCSMENLQTKPRQEQSKPPIKLSATESLVHSKASNIKAIKKKQTNEPVNQDDDADIDADNVEDAEDDDDDDEIEIEIENEDEVEKCGGGDNDADDSDVNNALKKSLKVITSSKQNTPSRKRTPSGCSSDSSPYGTERSSRIRTSDWIEVGDNGKQVTLTSCHISLEDSGMEDEERMDEMSSSGVGDSWDSVKEAEQQQHQQHHLQLQHQQQQHQQQQQHTKRNRNVKRIMSINDLPPLPKSLSGINKMLASDSGVLSDVDTEMAKNAKNMEMKHMENQKENCSTINLNHSNYNNNNSSSNNSNNNNSNSNNNNCSHVINTTEDNKLASNNDGSGNGANANISSIINSNAPASTSGLTGAATTTTTTTPLKEINGNETISEIPPAIPGSKLDNQIATLRKEMFGLRQLDLSLLSQLWALNDSIQEFRTMIQDNEQEDDETYSTHSHSPSPYDSVSSDNDDEISALKGKKHMELTTNSNVITTQPKFNNITNNHYLPEDDDTNNQYNASNKIPAGPAGHDDATTQQMMEQKTQLIKPSPLPKPMDMKPVARMRSAPPPPPTTHRKSQNAPPRPT